MIAVIKTFACLSAGTLDALKISCGQAAKEMQAACAESEGKLKEDLASDLKLFKAMLLAASNEQALRRDIEENLRRETEQRAEKGGTL